MNEKIVKLAEKVRLVKPLDGRVLVHPLRLRTYKDEQIVLDDEKNKGKDPLTEEMEVKKVKTDINYRYQKAVVLKVPDDEVRFQIGDIIVYDVGSLKEFDLFKGVSVLRKYDIVAITTD